MDIIFNCPHCEQELAVDSSGAGSKINCPACGEEITIPNSKGAPAMAGHGADAHVVNPINASAAAKVERHLRVPVHSTPTESLIEKPRPPLDAAAAKESDKGIHAKTIRHTDCIEVGHDKFDEIVTKFLMKIGESNIISITPITYTNLDIGTQKIMTEYGVLVIYRG